MPVTVRHTLPIIVALFLFVVCILLNDFLWNNTDSGTCLYTQKQCSNNRYYLLTISNGKNTKKTYKQNSKKTT